MKSNVTMQQIECRVCGDIFDNGPIPLDLHLQKRLNRKTTSCFGLCPKCTNLYLDGHIALIEVDASKSRAGQPLSTGGYAINATDAVRTGRTIHVKKAAFKNLFNADCRDSHGKLRHLVFINNDAFEKIRQMIARITN